jgi:transposase
MIPAHDDDPGRDPCPRRVVGDPRAAAAARASSLYGGRTRTVLDRNCFAAIVYMARTSTPWRLLPAGELGCGSEATVRPRLVEWSNAGVFERLHDQLLDRLGAQGLVGWSRASLDTMSVRAKRGGPRWCKSGRSWQAWVQAAPDRGRPRAAAGTGDSKDNRASLRQRGITPRLARGGVESSTTLGRHRWKVKRSLSWLSCYRRLRVRWERDSDRFLAFVRLACALACFKRALAGHNQRHAVV